MQQISSLKSVILAPIKHFPRPNLSSTKKLTLLIGPIVINLINYNVLWNVRLAMVMQFVTYSAWTLFILDFLGRAFEPGFPHEQQKQIESDLRTTLRIPETPDWNLNHNEDLYLVLKSKEDWNGALGLITPSAYNTAQTYGKVVLVDIESLSDLARVVKSLTAKNNRIKACHIHAHGTPTSMQLGQQAFLKCSLENDPKIERTFARLENNAPIILTSCSTGNVDAAKQTGSICIAQKLASLAGGRIVFAPTQPTGRCRLLTKNGELTAEFYLYKVNPFRPVGLFSDISTILGVFFLDRHFPMDVPWMEWQNVTNCFREPPG